MHEDTEGLLAVIAADSRYRALVRRRSRLAWSLATLVFGTFMAFTLVLALDRPLLAHPVGGLTMSWGIPVGFAIIVLAVASIALFAWASARDFDPAMAAIVADARA